MSLPSREALTAGKRFSASQAALTKKPIKPRRVPLWVFSKSSLYWLRSSIIGFMLTSLKVVNMAVPWDASSRRSAMRARIRVIGTRFSTRSPTTRLSSEAFSGACEAVALAAASGLSVALGCSMWETTSSLVIRPPLPVALIAAASRPFSSIILRAAGLTFRSSADFAGADSSFLGSASFLDVLDSALSAGALPLAPSLKRPITSSLSTVSPSPLTISSTTPSAGATTSSTTLSVSISTSSSSRLQASPGCLCQVAMVPSATDSGKVGALISVVIRIP